MAGVEEGLSVFLLAVGFAVGLFGLDWIIRNTRYMSGSLSWIIWEGIVGIMGLGWDMKRGV